MQQSLKKTPRLLHKLLYEQLADAWMDLIYRVSGTRPIMPPPPSPPYFGLTLKCPFYAQFNCKERQRIFQGVAEMMRADGIRRGKERAKSPMETLHINWRHGGPLFNSSRPCSAPDNNWGDFLTFKLQVSHRLLTEEWLLSVWSLHRETFDVIRQNPNMQ